MVWQCWKRITSTQEEKCEQIKPAWVSLALLATSCAPHLTSLSCFFAAVNMLTAIPLFRIVGSKGNNSLKTPEKLLSLASNSQPSCLSLLRKPSQITHIFSPLLVSYTWETKELVFLSSSLADSIWDYRSKSPGWPPLCARAIRTVPLVLGWGACALRATTSSTLHMVLAHLQSQHSEKLRREDCKFT